MPSASPLGPLLPSLARQAIAAALGKAAIPDPHALTARHPLLACAGAVFVTLTEQGHLRGCIGSIVAHRPLIDDLLHNARAAAFDDPRFPPVTRDELEGLDVEVSLLSPPQPLAYTDTADLKAKIHPGRDGVILRDGPYQATFLPQVWEQLPRFDDFFAHLCAKAGVRPDCLSRHPEILTYTVDKFTES